MTPSTHVSAGCICGGSVDVKASSLRAANDVLDAFRQVHTGPGHAPTDAQRARRLGRAKPKAGV